MNIKVYSGKVDNTCTISANLTENQMKKPAIREVMEYAEPRMLSTLIVSGAKTPWDLQDNNKKTKIGVIPDKDLVGDVAYRYPVMGRIQRKSIIDSQIGTTQSDGTFQLKMKDDLLYNGMVTRFHGNFHARVMGDPQGSTYTFQSLQGAASLFVFATNTQGQGEKSCFGGFTAYGQRSPRGYSRSFFNDMYTNHLTIQRKTIGISGSALSDVTWVEFNGAKGWFYTKEAECRLQLMMENEYHKWFSESTMVDSAGNLLSRSSLRDERGEDIVIGNGVIPQLEGGNSFYTSGVNGEATIDDFGDMMQTLEKKSNSVYGKVWYVITGTDGYGNAQDQLRDYRVNLMGGRSNMNDSQTQKVGGEDIPVGGNFDTFNFRGNQLVFVKHPMFDDEQRFTDLGVDGKPIMSSQYIFLDTNVNRSSNKPNVEILSKGAYGVNRSFVSGYINGLTGFNDKPMLTSTDALEFNTLKEDGIFIYNTTSCGLLKKPTA